MIIIRNRNDSSNLPSSWYALAADRATTWQPGLTYNGGIPAGYTQQGSTITTTGTTADRRATVQAALDAASAAASTGNRKYVQLGAGDFYFSSYLTMKSFVKLVGAGPTTTRCFKTNPANQATGQGASPHAFLIMTEDINIDLDGVTVAGVNTFASQHTFTAAAGNGDKGTFTVTLNNVTGLAAGQVVRVDELSGADWHADPYFPTANIWASADWLIVYPKHNPEREVVDDFSGGASGPFPADPDHWYTAYTCPDRPTCEMKEIASVNAGASTVTFSTPLHIAYRNSHSARVARYSNNAANGAAVEQLTASGFDDGTICFKHAKNCWITDVEIDNWFDKPVNFQAAFRCEARRVYQHGTPWPSNSAENYAFIYNWASADCLIEDCISIECDKVVAARAAGAGCVFGYNYLDRGFIGLGGQDNWVEVGANASHLVGPHHVLFEGNWSWNADSDFTHGNSVHVTHFRNHYTGFRTRYTSIRNGFYYDDRLGNQVGSPPSGQLTNGPKRCGAMGQFGFWHSFIGNVLGLSGAMAGWSYENVGTENWDQNVWLLGWDPPDNGSGPFSDGNAEPDETLALDGAFAGALIRDGNYDYLTGQVHWHGRGGSGSGNGLTPPAASTLSNSLYQSAKPAFFGSNTWPWVDAQGATKTFTLPAKARFDAGTPFA